MMQKITVFYIGATIMVIGILASLLGYQFLFKEEQEDPLQQPNQVVEEQEKEISDTISKEKEDQITNAVISERQTPEYEEDKYLITENKADFSSSTITKELMLQAGFEKPIIQMSLFNGVIFSQINLREYINNNHISYKTYENNEHAGDITEFIATDNYTIDTLYTSIKTKIENQEGFEANETDQYGDRSFFANFDQDTNSVFLVVKLKTRLYTLHYPAKNHNKMKNLVLSL